MAWRGLPFADRGALHILMLRVSPLSVICWGSDASLATGAWAALVLARDGLRVRRRARGVASSRFGRARKTPCCDRPVGAVGSHDPERRYQPRSISVKICQILCSESGAPSILRHCVSICFYFRCAPLSHRERLYRLGAPFFWECGLAPYADSSEHLPKLLARDRGCFCGVTRASSDVGLP